MKYIVYRTVFFLVLVAAVAGIIFVAYNAGWTRGVASNTTLPAVNHDNPPAPFYGWWPSPFFGFGCFIPLSLIFLFFMVFGAARSIIWGPRSGWHTRWHRYNHWGERGSGREIPPMIVEMHRRMHAAEEEKPSENTAQK